MSNISKANLLDKDIRLLKAKTNRYIKSVGNPKELYIWVNPSGIKRFCVRVDDNGKTKHIKLKEFREGIYSVAEARRDANIVLKEHNSGKDIATIRGKNDKYLFKNLVMTYLNNKKELKGLSDSSYKRDLGILKHLFPSFENKNAKDIKYSDLLEVLKAINLSLGTKHRMIGYLHKVFAIAKKDRYIDQDPSEGLGDEFMSQKKYNLINGIDNRHKAITDTELLRDFIRDLKADCSHLATKRAMYIQILTANRPANTAEAKWEDIDLENGIWTIKSKEMKIKTATHTIALNSYAIKILKEQKLLSANSRFVFPSIESKSGHLSAQSITNGLQDLGHRDKYKDLVTSHGFRSTFKTFCSINEAELLKKGIGEKIIEECLAHKEKDNIISTYERKRATIEQKIKLMQWYGDFLNDIEPLF